MTFQDQRLSEDIERGAVGGQRFKTAIASMASGFEQRNQDWAQSRSEWDLSYGVQDKTDFTQLINHFAAMRGRLHSFPFKDWSDFEIGDILNPTTNSQIIGTGDDAETNFQMIKDYTAGAFTYTRTIVLPVITGSVLLFDDVVQGAGFSLSRTTGIYNITVPPGAGVVVSTAALFDVPVRYDDDLLAVALLWEEAGSVPAAPIFEVRGESL